MKLTIGFSRALFLTAFTSISRVRPMSTSAGGQRRAKSPRHHQRGRRPGRAVFLSARLDAANRELFCFMTPDLP